jgi:hypothetical protein
MKNYTGFSRYAGNSLARLLAISFLVFSWSAQATAPRITAQLFGEERKSDIVAYQSADAASGSVNALEMEIVNEAFKAAGKTPVVDVLPSKQLATYALFNNDVAALVGEQQDLSAMDKKLYRAVTFYLRTPGDEPVLLIFGKKHARANELYLAFNEGLQKILKNGKYLKIMAMHHVKAPAEYSGRLKRHNPGWK